MSDDPQDPDAPAPVASMPDLQGLVVDLNIAPTWAKQGAANPYADARGEDRPDRGPRREGRGDWGRGGGRDKDRRGPPRGGPQGGDRRREDRRGEDRRGDRPGPRSRDGRPPQRFSERPPPRLPVDVAFIPERQHLGAVVRQIHATQKTYPLAHLASLFLNQPEWHLIKVESKAGGDGTPLVKFFQCTADGAVFLDAESARAHAIGSQLDQFFDTEEVEVEAPTGNFSCVGRCRLSGEILGPPNHHGYNEKILDLHRRRFSHLRLDDYRGQVEIVRDPALIEAWKEASRKRTVYKAKGQPDAPALKREEAVAKFAAEQLPGLIKISSRVMIPPAAMASMHEGPLKAAIHDAWTRESRFPLGLLLALRPAFKRMHLHVFKSGRETFVTCVPPKALDPSHVVEPIRSMLQMIQDHPGWNRKRILEHLRPELALESPEATEFFAPLRWLVEKGHVIEYFNGTLAVPSPQHIAKESPAAIEPADPPAAAAPPPEPPPTTESAGESDAPAAPAAVPTPQSGEFQG